MTVRDLGKLIFSTLQDSKGKVQLIFQKEDIDKEERGFAKNLVGTGPFQALKNPNFKRKSIVLLRNEDYYLKDKNDFVSLSSKSICSAES